MNIRYLTRAAVAFGAMAAFSGAAVAQGIDNSDHDLAAGGADNNEICVYCHTPHGARTNIEAPLWNKPDNGQTYQTYDSTTIDGTVLAVGSVSAACLTCHDGTQAMDAVINAPGTGAGTGNIGTVGTMPPNSIANLGTDLRNDHPIGIQYGGFISGTATAQIDPDFVSGVDLQVENIQGQDRWWIDTAPGTANVRDKNDIIFYTRDNTVDNTGLEPFVECASCHDPHNNANGTFLRISNNNSDVCLACHVK